MDTMVLRVGLIKFIFTVHLWKLCSAKFIENESFVRTFRANTSDNEVRILNGSLATVLGLHSPSQNSTTINVKLQRDVRMRRKLDNYGTDGFFYVQTRDANTLDNKNVSDRYYINYRKAYGIRYDPRKIKRSFSFKDSEDSEDNELSTTNEPFYDSTTITNDFQEENQDEGVYDAEEGFLNAGFQNQSNWPINITETDNFVDESHFYDGHASNITDSPFTNVAKPSKIQTALQHLNMKIKNLFSVNVNANPSTQRFLNVFNIIKFDNVPCASSKPPLTQMNGVCYHKFECDQLGGVAVDTCAGGFGVCCICKFFRLFVCYNVRKTILKGCISSEVV